MAAITRPPSRRHRVADRLRRLHETLVVPVHPSATGNPSVRGYPLTRR